MFDVKLQYQRYSQMDVPMDTVNKRLGNERDSIRFDVSLPTNMSNFRWDGSSQSTVSQSSYDCPIPRMQNYYDKIPGHPQYNMHKYHQLGQTSMKYTPQSYNMPQTDQYVSNKNDQNKDFNTLDFNNTSSPYSTSTVDSMKNSPVNFFHNPSVSSPNVSDQSCFYMKFDTNPNFHSKCSNYYCTNSSCLQSKSSPYQYYGEINTPHTTTKVSPDSKESVSMVHSTENHLLHDGYSQLNDFSRTITTLPPTTFSNNPQSHTAPSEASPSSLSWTSTSSETTAPPGYAIADLERQSMCHGMSVKKEVPFQGHLSFVSNKTVQKTRTVDKYRQVYTERQKLELEKEYVYQNYVSPRRKLDLAIQLHLSERQIKIWFQNRRAKERKLNKK